MKRAFAVSVVVLAIAAVVKFFVWSIAEFGLEVLQAYGIMLLLICAVVLVIWAIDEIWG